ESEPCGDAATQRESADDRTSEPEMVQQIVEVEHPVAEGHPRRILGALRPRMPSRLPQDEAVPRGDGPHVGLPPSCVQADAVRPLHGRSRAMLLVVAPDAGARPEVGHLASLLSVVCKKGFTMERSFAAEVKQLIDPRPSLQNLARMIAEGFGVRETRQR